MSHGLAYYTPEFNTMVVLEILSEQLYTLHISRQIKASSAAIFGLPISSIVTAFARLLSTKRIAKPSMASSRLPFTTVLSRAQSISSQVICMPASFSRKFRFYSSRPSRRAFTYSVVVVRCLWMALFTVFRSTTITDCFRCRPTLLALEVLFVSRARGLCDV